MTKKKTKHINVVCIVCGAKLSQRRALVCPNAVTCSTECTELRNTKLKRDDLIREFSLDIRTEKPTIDATEWFEKLIPS